MKEDKNYDVVGNKNKTKKKREREWGKGWMIKEDKKECN